MTINWINPKVGGRRSSTTTTGLAFRVANHKGGKAPHATTMGVVYVYPIAMKALRWQIGDRVMIGSSPDKRDVYIRRVTSGGFALTASGGDKKRTKQGTFACGMVKTAQIVFPDAADIGPDDYIVMDDGTVMFSIPPSMRETVADMLADLISPRKAAA